MTAQIELPKILQEFGNKYTHVALLEELRGLSKLATKTDDEGNAIRGSLKAVVENYYNETSEGQAVLREIDVSGNLEDHVNAVEARRYTQLADFISDPSRAKQLTDSLDDGRLELLLGNEKAMSQILPQESIAKYKVASALSRMFSGNPSKDDMKLFEKYAEVRKAETARDFVEEFKDSSDAILFIKAITRSELRPNPELRKKLAEFYGLDGTENIYQDIRQALVGGLGNLRTRGNTAKAIYEVLK